MVKIIPLVLRCVAVLAFCSSVLGAYGQVNFKWALGLSGADGSYGRDMAVTSNKDVIVVGDFYGTVDFNPGPAVFNLTSVGASDIYFAKYDSLGTFIFAKAIYCSGPYEHAFSVALDAADNIYICGNFEGTGDFDPGAGVVNHNTVIGDDGAYIAKYDVNGNYIFSKSFSGTGADAGYYKLKLDATGNIITYGKFTNTFDADGGAGVVNLTSTGSWDVCLTRYDNSGNFISAFSLGGTAEEDALEFDLTAAGDILLTGNFKSPTIDMDPGAGVASLTSAGSQNMFLAKYDPSNQYLNAFRFGTSSLTSHPYNIKIDGAGDIAIGGTFSGTGDFNPGPATNNLTSIGGADAFFVKFDASLNYLFGFNIGTSSTDGCYALTTDADNNIYVAGAFGYTGGTADFDPGLGIANLTSAGGQADLFVAKYSSTGAYMHAFSAGSSTGYGEIVEGIITDIHGNIYITGTFNTTVDFDPGPGVFNLSCAGLGMYTAKYTPDHCANIILSVDSITNASCFTPGYAGGHVENAEQPYFFQWNTSPVTNDSVAAMNSEGIYTVTLTDNNNCTVTRGALVNAPGGSGFDLNLFAVTNTFHTALGGKVWLNAFNANCDTVSGTLLFIRGQNLPALSVSSSISPDSVTNDTLIWFFGPTTFDSTHITVLLQLSPLGWQLGDTVCFDIVFLPLNGDVDTTNNIRHYCIPVTGAFDPNDKQVYPQGVTTHGFITNNQTMAYTVRFQNTGTAQAINISIVDTLQAGLDTTSLHIAASSHPVFAEFLSGNVVRFRFDNIMLPDSGSNEPGSHGYVIYEIEQLNNLTDGNILLNTAHIYFDNNPAIVTNTVINTICNLLPSIPVNNTPVTNLEICANNTTTLSASANGTLYWYASPTSNAIIGTGNSFITPVLSTNTVFYVADSTCYQTTRIPVAVIVNSLPLVSVSLYTDTVCVDNGIFSVGNGTPAGGIFSGPGITGSNFNAFQAGIGNHTVTYAFIDTNNCQDTATAQMVVDNCSSITEPILPGLAIFPNPTTGIFHCELPDSYNATIYNALGEIIIEHRQVNGITTFNLSPFQNGVYLLRVTAAGKTTMVRVNKSE